ncbi:hypothetical protein ACI4CD_28870, partial [Klebsiella pneumoniae]|uniref:hypothetical protein n=1 Tax=Klebsiella pneumoniae TaxID=573 RepID=UPI0038555E33
SMAKAGHKAAITHRANHPHADAAPKTEPKKEEPKPATVGNGKPSMNGDGNDGKIGNGKPNMNVAPGADPKKTVGNGKPKM